MGLEGTLIRIRCIHREMYTTYIYLTYYFIVNKLNIMEISYTTYIVPSRESGTGRYSIGKAQPWSARVVPPAGILYQKGLIYGSPTSYTDA